MLQPLVVPEWDAPDEASRMALVRDGYDAIADRYTDLFRDAPLEHPRRAHVARVLSELRPGGTVLELGCGGGLPVAADVIGAGQRYLGIDVSPAQVEVARRNVVGAQFAVGDALEQQFDPSTFGAILMLYAITHVPRERWRDLFESVLRWLVPGGHFLVTLAPHESTGWLEEDFLGFPGATNWTNSLEPQAAIGLLETVGFTVTDVRLEGEDHLDPAGWYWVHARSRASIDLQ